ncbi:MAG: STAS domain-containing protein [Alphaproteobacteria bacterium]|nr:STAS domain-containing protein [Alphaproteobacteria bacterium]
MDYKLTRESQGPILVMEGRFVHKDFAKIKELVAQLKQGGGTSGLTLDLAGIEFIDSAGIGMLLLIREELGGGITLRGAKGQPAQLLVNAHMDQLFRLAN